jgi:hypothetical protein
MRQQSTGGIIPSRGRGATCLAIGSVAKTRKPIKIIKGARLPGSDEVTAHAADASGA